MTWAQDFPNSPHPPNHLHGKEKKYKIYIAQQPKGKGEIKYGSIH